MVERLVDPESRTVERDRTDEEDTYMGVAGGHEVVEYLLGMHRYTVAGSDIAELQNEAPLPAVEVRTPRIQDLLP